MPSVTTPSTSRYHSLRRLAAGGMGEVELAVRREGGFQRLYAVKRLRPELRDDAAARTMFIDEARLSGLIRHPNVVSVLDVGDDERGPFLVMDYVEGVSAGALLKWASGSSIALPVQLCLRVAREIALGLHSAHELHDHKGVHLHLVHRDVSPQNILIGFDGIARIADFGIAKAAGRTTRTTTGLLKGKAGYMAPEQLRFEEPDRRTDIFSLGVVLYELLASARLYKAETDIVSARRILNEAPPDIDDVRDDVPPSVVDLLFRSLAKDPTVRPDSAHDFAATLESALATLVEVDGAFDVGGYLCTHFAERQAALRELVTEARTDLSLTSPESLEKTPDSKNYRKMALALVGAAALLTGVWFVAADSPAPELRPTTMSSEVPSAPEAATPVDVTPERNTRAENPSGELAPTNEEEAEAHEVETPTAPTKRRRRRGSAMRRRERPNEAELFDWNE